MPIKSKEQYGFMRAAASKAKGLGGISQGQAKEFLEKTPKKKLSMFSKGK